MPNLKSLTYVALIILSACNIEEPSIFGIPQSHWNQLTTDQKNMVIQSKSHEDLIRAARQPNHVSQQPQPDPSVFEKISNIISLFSPESKAPKAPKQSNFDQPQSRIHNHSNSGFAGKPEILHNNHTTNQYNFHKRDKTSVHNTTTHHHVFHARSVPNRPNKSFDGDAAKHSPYSSVERESTNNRGASNSTSTPFYTTNRGDSSLSADKPATPAPSIKIEDVSDDNTRSSNNQPHDTAQPIITSIDD